MQDLISIIIPVYKCEDYLEKCLTSIINQTFSKFEVIIINDGSPDRCDIICKNFLKKDNRIRYYYQNNRGVSAARNYGISLANGQYLTFVDGDDYLLDTHLFQLYDEMSKSELDLVALSYDDYEKRNIFYLNKETAIEKMLLNDSFGVAVHNKLYKTHIIKNNNLLFSVGKKIAEDFEFLINYTYCIKKIAYIEHMNTYIKVESKYSSGKITNYQDKLIGMLYGYALIRDERFLSSPNIINALTIREFRICVGTYTFYPEPINGEYTKFIKNYIRNNYCSCIKSKNVEIRYKIFATLILISTKLVRIINKFIISKKYS